MQERPFAEHLLYELLVKIISDFFFFFFFFCVCSAPGCEDLFPLVGNVSIFVSAFEIKEIHILIDFRLFIIFLISYLGRDFVLKG